MQSHLISLQTGAGETNKVRLNRDGSFLGVRGASRDISARAIAETILAGDRRTNSKSVYDRSVFCSGTDMITKRVVAAVIERNGRYLLCQRPSGKHHAGLWEFPGGKVHKGETDSAALKRELSEELDVMPWSEPVLTAEYADETSEFLICFMRTEVAGNPKCLEHASIGWFLPREIQELHLAPADERFSVQYLL